MFFALGRPSAVWFVNYCKPTESEPTRLGDAPTARASTLLLADYVWNSLPTSWAYFTQGHWLESVQSNTGGFLLAIAACVVVVASAVCVVKPDFDVTQYHKQVGVAAIGITLVTLLDWVFRLYQ